MAKLKINTRQLNSIAICGEFCNWNIDTSIIAERTNGSKYIILNEMPIGEYKIFGCKSFTSSEVYPNGRKMDNRYFSGEHYDIIDVFFNDFMEVKNG